MLFSKRRGIYLNFLYDWLAQFQQFILDHLWFAPLSAVLLPFLEALIPSLPLTILISFNLSIMASSYGTATGTILTILLSTLGSMIGMVGIFFLIRWTLAPYFTKKVQDNKYGKMFLNLVQGPNTFLVLILLSNPFLPSSILNYALSLTNIKVSRYLWLTLVSRLLIVIFLVFLGSIFNIQQHPLNALWVLLVYTLLFFVWGFWVRRTKQKPSDSQTVE